MEKSQACVLQPNHTQRSVWKDHAISNYTIPGIFNGNFCLNFLKQCEY